jgi:hypothetical protein
VSEVANWVDTLLTRLSAARATAIDNINADTQIRIAAAGSKAIGAAGTKYLSIDSGTNGAEILAIVIAGLAGELVWTVDLYVPVADAVASPASGDAKTTIAYNETDYAGLLDGFAMPFNSFLNFTNGNGIESTITQVQVIYRSRAALSLAWET